jgi:hypothetical protein
LLDQGRGDEDRVLACRIAGSLAQHEPGWRLPRLTILARHYGVSTEQIATAVDELVARHLIRRLPNGKLYRASPAEYHLPLPPESDTTVRVRVLTGTLCCRSRNVTSLRLREDVARSLGVDPDEPGSMLRLLFAIEHEPVAVSVTYGPAALSPVLQELAAADCPDVLPLTPAGPDRVTVSVQLGLQQPPAGLASTLRLPASEQATVITARSAAADRPDQMALTFAVLRPEFFGVTIQSNGGAAHRLAEALASSASSASSVAPTP